MDNLPICNTNETRPQQVQQFPQHFLVICGKSEPFRFGHSSEFYVSTRFPLTVKGKKWYN